MAQIIHPAWQLKMTALSAVYLMVQKQQSFPIVGDGAPSDVFQAALKELFMKDLLNIDRGKYVVADKGMGILRNSIAAVDVIRQFDVFSSVVPRLLDENEWLSPNDPAFIRWDMYDPRFNRDVQDETGKDMRPAVITWIGERLKGNAALKGMEIDLHEVVFMQQLGSGAYNTPDFLSRLLDGSLFREVEETVAGAWKWRALDPDGNEDVASRNMQTLFTVGMLESRKRDAPSCGGDNCGIPLYSYEEEARQNKTRLASCPNCRRSFDPPPPNTPGVSECPKCRYLIYDGDRTCGGCGALIDLSLPIGSGVTDTVEETVPVFTTSYGYVSCGWVDPYDVMLSAAIFGALCVPVWDPYCYW